jgi:DNA-binding protein H-NS
MDDSIRQLPFDQLRTLHREIGALIAEKRSEALEQLRQQAQVLGFTADDLMPKKTKANGAKVRYRDPSNPEFNTYGGKGPKPQWLKDYLDEGRPLEEFLVS